MNPANTYIDSDGQRRCEGCGRVRYCMRGCQFAGVAELPTEPGMFGPVQRQERRPIIELQQRPTQPTLWTGLGDNPSQALLPGVE